MTVYDDIDYEKNTTESSQRWNRILETAGSQIDELENLTFTALFAEMLLEIQLVYHIG